MKRRQSVYRVFAIPLSIFVLGIFGLISALLFDNLVDLLASLAVGMPVAIVFWMVFFRARAQLLKRKHGRHEPD